jgi:hypothetical protein
VVNELHKALVPPRGQFAQRISRTGSWRWNVGTGAVSSSAELLNIWGFDAMARVLSYTTFMVRVHPEDRLASE